VKMRFAFCLLVFALMTFAALPLETKAEKLNEEELFSILIAIEDEMIYDELFYGENCLKPNEAGQIMVIMYHGISSEGRNNDLERSAWAFRNDLEKLYERDYRLIKLEDLISGNIDIPAGKTPVILTFDDGERSAFSLVEGEAGLEPSPNCAVGIINEFCREFPDFGKAAVFYINAYKEPFYGAGSVEERFNYLIENGFELGNHTYSHVNISKLNKDQIEEELEKLDSYVNKYLPDYNMQSFCYPYGERPCDDRLKPYVLNGRGYSYEIALKAGPTGTAGMPWHIDFDRLNFPRVRGTDYAKYDLGWYIKYYDNNPHLRYVSDGNRDVISVPESYGDKIDEDKIGGRKLNIY